MCVLLLAATWAVAMGAAADETKVPAFAQFDFRQIVKEAKARVFPAVVFIKCIREGHEGGKKQTQEVSGSGVLLSADGELVTNWHVVDKAIEVRCLLLDGTAYHAEVLGTDKDTDLALLKLKRKDGDPPLPYAELGDSDALTEGDFVMAMGAPWGMSRSVSIGIISCTRRYLENHSEYSLWLQSDAAISPGNSGGPLVNTQGQVIGINALGMFYGGDMGFAIPSNTLARMVPQLREQGRGDWSWTGVRTQPIRDFNRDMYFEGTEGVIVASIDPESPAKRAGLLKRDRIMKINGEPINALTEEDLPAVRRRLGLLARGEEAIFLVQRGDETVTIKLTPRAKGNVEGEELECARWDLTVKSINQFDNPSLYFHRKQGVFIFGTEYPGNASQAGLRGNDIILKVDGQAVKTLEDLEKIHAQAVENIKTKTRAVFTVLRSGLMRQLVIEYSRDYEKD